MRPRPKIASEAPAHTAGVRRCTDPVVGVRRGFFTSGETRSPTKSAQTVSRPSKRKS